MQDSEMNHNSQATATNYYCLVLDVLNSKDVVYFSYSSSDDAWTQIDKNAKNITVNAGDVVFFAFYDANNPNDDSPSFTFSNKKFAGSASYTPFLILALPPTFDPSVENSGVEVPASPATYSFSATYKSGGITLDPDGQIIVQN